jgi:hypothetical protein
VRRLPARRAGAEVPGDGRHVTRACSPAQPAHRPTPGQTHTEDLSDFARLGIPEELLIAARVRRVNDAEGRELRGTRCSSLICAPMAKAAAATPTYGVKEAADVQDWFHWLVTQQHSACIFGMGESMGAAIILQAVRTTPFCGVVAESPFASFRPQTGLWRRIQMPRPPTRRLQRDHRGT